MEGIKDFLWGKYNMGEEKKYQLSRESLERLSFIQKTPLASFTPIHFIFHLISSLFVSRSLSSPLGPTYSSCYGDVIVVLLRD